MKRNTIIITVLVLIALGLGGAIYYKQYYPKTADNNNGNEEQSAPKEVRLSDADLDKDLTEQQKAIFYNPGPDATAEQQQAYFDLASSAAVAGDMITINGCKASPDVLKTQVGKSVKVKNDGTADIQFGVSETKVTVKAGATVEVKDLFTHGAGLYGYGCENPGVRRAIGMVLVTP